MRYDCPHHWLLDKARVKFIEGDIEWLLSTVLTLTHALDDDTLQGTFEDRMEADGYFEEEE